MLKQKGEASKMKPGGSDESYLTHGNHPQRAAWDDGHQLNESYKVPSQHVGGRPNYSYLHPHVSPGSEWAPAMAGKDPSVPEEKELRTKAPAGMSGKIVFPAKQGKNKS
jgi:hypothetical protein